ncbi:cilia- and flagella-associated protein 91-like isoform X2 [Coccinella septempunctata]|uniref:cilia- and flagella-associated protein 91-like isoform X2 n=1 Tax=Coccinella septempunctata TaxID=41139 RepID=UPI001D091D74|nr:cilia- and flagella-associated protein 91-like isoform X2 [Coccinella septempunctata]
MTITQIKNLSYRPQDLVYDPLFVVSGPRDHYKAEVLAKMAMAKYQVCPVFSTMFSDLPSYPRKQLVLRKPREIPSYKQQKQRSDQYFRQIHNKPHPIHGSDRPKFFSFPIITYPSDVIPYLHFPAFTLKKMPKDYGEIKDKAAGGRINQNIQTDYRESEMQTSPWQPDYRVFSNDGSTSPQLLKLDFLKWGSGLPAGKNEVVLVERARMKRAWEKYLPPPTDEATLAKRRDIIEAMERDEWAFREQEIHEIQELRMKLLEEMLTELHRKTKERNELKLRNIAEIKKTETDAKIQKLRKNTERELRKLELKHRGVKTKYHATDVVEEHAHPKSELYAPLMRHGEHPMRWHQVMDERLKYYKAQFIGVEEFSTLPRWINKATILKDDYNTAKLPGTHICMRETKWTTPVLKKLHEELKNLHKTTKRKCTLRVRIDRTISEASTPETDELPEMEEDKYQALITLQSILKGRASQMLIYEGRDKCRELIRELKYSTGLLDEQRERIGETRKKIKHQQREEAIQRNRISKLQKSLNKLEGSVVGSLLDFLNKELRRLLDERRAHAICFLNERERNDREAAEAGRRQQELRRRREHDEMFKQMVKVHQDTVDLYLQDIITEGMDFASSDEATDYIQKLTQRIEIDLNAQLEKSIEVSEQEETIADLVHHFVLPEVQKQMVRDRIKLKQTQKLKRINDTLMDDLIETLPSPKKEDVGPEDELPPSGFNFKYQTEGELMETLWKDDEHPTFVSGTVSTVHDEEDEDKFRKESGSDIRQDAETEEIIALEELGKAADELEKEVEPSDDIGVKTEKETRDETGNESQDVEVGETIGDHNISNLKDET